MSGQQVLPVLRAEPLRVLVACEYSGTVRDAFRALGHDAMSCDLASDRGAGSAFRGRRARAARAGSVGFDDRASAVHGSGGDVCSVCRRDAQLGARLREALGSAAAPTLTGILEGLLATFERRAQLLRGSSTSGEQYPDRAAGYDGAAELVREVVELTSMGEVDDAERAANGERVEGGYVAPLVALVLVSFACLQLVAWAAVR